MDWFYSGDFAIEAAIIHHAGSTINNVTNYLPMQYNNHVQLTPLIIFM